MSIMNFSAIFDFLANAKSIDNWPAFWEALGRIFGG